MALLYWEKRDALGIICSIAHCSVGEIQRRLDTQYIPVLHNACSKTLSIFIIFVLLLIITDPAENKIAAAVVARIKT